MLLFFYLYVLDGETENETKDKRRIRETDCPWLRMRLHLAQGHQRHRIGAPFVCGKMKKKRKKEKKRCACTARLGATEPIGDLTIAYFCFSFLSRGSLLRSTATLLCRSSERTHARTHAHTRAYDAHTRNIYVQRDVN